MRGDQKKRRNGDEKNDVGEEIANRVLVSLKPGIDAVEVTSQLVQFVDYFLNLEKNWTNDAEVARAMLARNRLVFDRFGAERALHQRDREFLQILIISSSSLALRSSARIASRLCIGCDG